MVYLDNYRKLGAKKRARGKGLREMMQDRIGKIDHII